MIDLKTSESRHGCALRGKSIRSARGGQSRTCIRERGRDMKRTGLVIATAIVALGLASQTASAGTASGGSALALASLTADHSPVVNNRDVRVLRRLLNGRGVRYPAGKKISVQADSIICRTSNVDLTSRSCELVYGQEKVSISGRRAHELFATLLEAGIAPDGAAGSIFAGLSNLACDIDPNVIAQKAGGGADCKFDPAKP